MVDVIDQMAAVSSLVLTKLLLSDHWKDIPGSIGIGIYMPCVFRFLFLPFPHLSLSYSFVVYVLSSAALLAFMLSHPSLSFLLHVRVLFYLFLAWFTLLHARIMCFPVLAAVQFRT